MCDVYLCIHLLYCRASMSVRTVRLNFRACMCGCCLLDRISAGILVRMHILNLKGADVIDLKFTVVKRGMIS